MHIPAGARIALCEECAKERGVSGQSSGERIYSYATDSDLQSSGGTENSQMPVLVDVQNLQVNVAFDAQYFIEVNKAKAKLFFVEATAFHAKAGTSVAKMESQQYIRKAFEAASTSLKLLRTLPEEQRDEVMYAQALLLHANLVGRVARFGQRQASRMKVSGGEMLQMLGDARRNAREASNVLRQLNHPDAGNAYRVLGVIENSQNNLKKALIYFIMALRAFLKPTKKQPTVWCAVAFWNVHITLMDLGDKQGSLPWLKQAAILHHQMCGSSHPYTRQYREKLSRLSHEAAQAHDHDEELRLSEHEIAAINDALGLGPDVSL